MLEVTGDTYPHVPTIADDFYRSSRFRDFKKILSRGFCSWCEERPLQVTEQILLSATHFPTDTLFSYRTVVPKTTTTIMPVIKWLFI